MCGIAGIYGNVDPFLRQGALKKASHLLCHRGPDGSGVYEDDGMVLSHLRLSIIDLSEHGDQPLYNEDRSIVLICNGEIYNYKELRAELIKQGHTFSSNSDCEVILHLYEEDPGNCDAILNKLTGMFAFALWDIKKQQLFIARDRLGIKPLYYYHSAGVICFASEVAPVAAMGLAGNDIDVTSLYEYFALGSIPGPHTIYKNIKALPPGHYIKVGNGSFDIKQYWDVPLDLKKSGSEQETIEEMDTLLSGIIKDHLVADVPVGTFLSAGVDSSLITAYAAEHQSGIFSFTASFPGEPEDEGIIAAETAKRLKTTHRSYELKENFFKDFASQFQYMDQPFGISSALSLGRISKMAQKDVKVVLSGDGADELLGGYARHDPYWQPPFVQKIPSRYRKAVVGTLAKLTANDNLRQLNAVMQQSLGEKYLARVQILPKELISSLFTPATLKNIDTERYRRHLDAYFNKAAHAGHLNSLLYTDVKTTLVDEMLTKCDRMTMRNAIEGRVPFLDHRFVEFAFSLPETYKRHNGTGKLLLRKLLAQKLGDGLAYRKKTGFNAPLKQWLKNDQETINYVREQISAAEDLPFFDKKQVQLLMEDLPANTDLSFYMVCLTSFFKK